MRASITIAVLSSAIVAINAQGQCLVECSDLGFKAANCGDEMDMSCLCSKAFSDAVLPCVNSKCSKEEVQDATSQYTEMCTDFASAPLPQNATESASPSSAQLEPSITISSGVPTTMSKATSTTQSVSISTPMSAVPSHVSSASVSTTASASASAIPLASHSASTKVVASFGAGPVVAVIGSVLAGVGMLLF